MSKNFYITTTIPYVNADPHIGFALEIVQADVLARYYRLMGEKVFFSTGTDEHGLKIYQKALEQNKNPQVYVDEYATKFDKLRDILNLSYDNFIRTTSPQHVVAAQEFWRRCNAKGDIYKKNYKIKYCVGCELEKTDSELVNGHCAIHPHLDLEIIEEENYFFKLSRYQKDLEVYLTGDVITPASRKEEAQKFVSRGLEDFSISRLKSKMPWGIPVPGDETQVMYVWFDALVNYISTLGWPDEEEKSNFRKFWIDGYTLQCAGKDQIRMQSVMWQAMLLSAGVRETQHIFYHGFINSGGQKMSKSLGNVINPFDLVERYSIDVVRYFLIRDVHPYEDSDVTEERIKESYNANLANGLGNLVARIMKLAETYLTEGLRPDPVGFSEEYTNSLEKFEFTHAMDFIWKRIQALDQKITETEPFKLVKTDPEKGKAIIFEMTQQLYTIARLLTPFMPATSKKIKEAIIANKKPEILFPRKEITHI